ncbi:glycosyltransferase family 4 protein [Phaeodactylibacter xiamenensis]|uniref:glycosyltransferase family 4 protein n=1 Tax=Phaeodactylibacter xiamenensis TaxID=1524460 RepID=UPI003CCC2315
MHIVFRISLGGGPEALLKNLAPLFKKEELKVTVILEKLQFRATHKFPKYFNIVALEKGSILPYYLYRLFGNLDLLKPYVSYLLEKEKESRLHKTLSSIESKEKIDIVEVTEGQFVDRISKKWRVFTRAHGSNWSFRSFCKDQDDSIDSYLIKWQRKQHLLSEKNFAISQHTKNHLTETCRLPEGTIEFIPYPIPMEAFQNATAASIEDLPEKAPLILSIGRLEKRKGMDTLVQAMPKVWKHFPETCLLLLGKETEFTIDQLRQMVPKDKRIQIIYPGFVHYSTIPSYYKAATVYVSASQYETFGYTLLESMAAGTPVICTDRGAMPELIENDKNGLVTPYDDIQTLSASIIKMLSSESLRKEFKKAGFKKAKNYDMATIGNKTIDAYKDLVHGC